MEEAYLKRAPRGAAETAYLARLSRYWQAQLVDLAGWTAVLDTQPLRLLLQKDLTERLGEDYGKMIRLARAGIVSDVPSSEQRAWELASTLVASGLVGYIRLVARMQP
jgi:hypothetical protein